MSATLIADYNRRWPEMFMAERDALIAALGKAMDGVIAMEHVGSTSVPGCAGKPIIDMMISVRGPAEGVRCITPIVALGYECVGEYGVPGRIYFRKGMPRSHHIHLVEHGCEFWQKHIAFRDLLRARPDLVEQYGALKRGLAARYVDDREGYTEAKTPFIQSALAQARAQTQAARPD